MTEGVYSFGGQLQTQGNPSKEEVGSKAFNLIKMAQIGLPVPPGFVIGTSSCREYLEAGGSLSHNHRQMLTEGIGVLQRATGLTFGGDRRPLLVSVRSGAAVSMPGMMDTILNVGLNDETVSSLIRMTGNPRFAWDSYSRLVQTYAEVVHDCPDRPFRRAADEFLRDARAESVQDLGPGELSGLLRSYLEVFDDSTGVPFPQDPKNQMMGAVGAVFRSWESARAREYRRVHQISGLAGTAVTVQTMVFGNMGSTSGSGVGFTRNPVTGEAVLFMDFLFNAQGEDVVSGRRQVNDAGSLASLLPDVFGQIQSIGKRLELEFGDMQDMEFTVQQAKLFMLQCRTGKRTPWAALRIAVDLVKEGVIDPQTGLRRLDGLDLSAISNTRLAATDERPIASGVPASSGVASGEVALDSDIAKTRAAAGHPVILVRDDTATSDIGGMVACAGMLTRLGGRTSHAAVVARQMNKLCIVGCSTLSIDSGRRTCSIGGRTLAEGDPISLDGNSGAVYAGVHAVVVERPSELLEEVERWRQAARADGGTARQPEPRGPMNSVA